MTDSLASLKFCYLCDNGRATWAHQFKHVKDGYQTALFAHNRRDISFILTRKGRTVAHELARKREAMGKPIFHTQVGRQ